MKKEYEKAELEITGFCAEDIIVTSPGNNETKRFPFASGDAYDSNDTKQSF